MVLGYTLYRKLFKEDIKEALRIHDEMVSVVNQNGWIIKEYEDKYVIEEDEESKVDPMVEYPKLVNRYIRQRYTQEDEYAILRKKLADIDDGEFGLYNTFCENCKKRAKQELGL